MKRGAIILLLSFIIIACSGNVKKSELNKAYEVEVVEAEGRAPIVNNDLNNAKQSSLQDALKNALHLVIGVYVSGDTLVSKSMLIDDEITSRTEGYIEKYSVLDEKVDNGFYKTKIKAYVRKEDLTKKIKTFENEVEKIGSPYIYVNIKDDENKKMDFAINGLVQKLREDFFRISSSMDEAEIIIDGVASTRFNTSEGLGGFISYNCSLTGSIKTKDGDMIGGFNSITGGIGVNENAAKNQSVANCVRTSYDEIKNSILNFYSQKKTVKLEVSDVDSLNDVQSIIKNIRTIPLVRNASLRDFSNNRALIEIVLHKGDARKISDSISSFGILKVIKLTNFSIHARFQK